MTETAAEDTGRQAAQRALTAGTTQRFAVLLVLMAVSGVQLASGLIQLPYLPGLQASADDAVGCVLAAGTNPAAAGLQLAAPTLRSDAAYDTCVARYGWSPAWWLALVITAGLVVVAALVYVLLASGRRRVAAAASVDPDGRLTAVLTELTATAGLDRPPCFVVDPTATTVSAVAYGLPRRHTVCLNGALVARLESDPATFRAVVLHELAHLRNRDVGLTYATLAAWRVYLIALLLPNIVAAAWMVLGPALFGIDAQSVFRPAEQNVELKFLAGAAFLVVLVYLARADALRTREAYADLDAAHWGAAVGSVAHQARSPGPARPAPLVAFLDLWRSHPGWRERAILQADAAAVFRVSALQTFLTGASAMLILEQFGDVTGTLASNGLPRYWPAVVAAVVLTTVTGVAVWRAAGYASIAGRPASSGLRAGLWLGFGLVAGELLEGLTLEWHWWPADPVFLLSLLLLGLVVTVWCAEFAVCCARAGRSREVAGAVAWSARLAMTAGLVAVGLAATAVLTWWYSAGELFGSGLPVASDQVLSLLTPGPATPAVAHHSLQLALSALFVLPSDLKWPVTLAAAALWTVPLVAWGVTAWGRQSVAPRRLLAAVLAGVAGGLVSVAGGLAAMAYLHSWRIPVSQRYGSFLFAYYGLLVACVIAGMVLAALGGAVFGRQNQFLAGLVATGVAAPLGIAGVYLLVGSDGCVAPLSTMVTFCSWKPAEAWSWVQVSAADALAVGAVAAMAVALLVVAGGRSLTALRTGAARSSRASVLPAGEPPQEAVLPARAGRIGRTAVAAVLTATAVTTLVVAGPSLGEVGRVSQASEDALLPASTSTNSPQLTTVMVAAWTTFGGKPLVSHLDQGYLAVGPPLSRMAAELAGKGPGGTVKVSGPRFKALAAPTARACASVLRTVDEADGYFPIPSAPLQQEWQRLLAEAGTDARDCVTGAAKPDPALFTMGVVNLSGLGEPLGTLTKQLTFAVDHFCRACA